MVILFTRCVSSPWLLVSDSSSSPPVTKSPNHAGGHLLRWRRAEISVSSLLLVKLGGRSHTALGSTSWVLDLLGLSSLFCWGNTTLASSRFGSGPSELWSGEGTTCKSKLFPLFRRFGWVILLAGRCLFVFLCSNSCCNMSFVVYSPLFCCTRQVS